MSGTNKYFIALDTPNQKYFPGGSVSGQVVLINHRDEKTRGINIEFEGSAYVNWYESRMRYVFTGDNQTSVVLRNVQKIYSSTDTYFRQKISLLTNERGIIKLQPGLHLFPFVFTISDSAPKSFSGPKGSITYTLSATLKRGSLGRDSRDKRATISIFIDSFLDLNTNIYAREPIAAQFQKTFSCLKFSGPVNISVQVPKRGFVPGEIVPITFDIDNQSKSVVTGAELYFTQVLHHHATKKSCTSVIKHLVATTSHVACCQHRQYIFNFTVPPARSSDPPNINRIITFEYFLEVHLLVHASTKTFIRKIPVYIGTVPIRDRNFVMSRPRLFVDDGNGNDNDPELEAQYDTNPILPLPRYHSASPSPCPSPNPSSINQGADNSESSISMPPAYDNFNDLPPSYSEAITFMLRDTGLL